MSASSTGASVANGRVLSNSIIDQGIHELSMLSSATRSVKTNLGSEVSQNQITSTRGGIKISNVDLRQAQHRVISTSGSSIASIGEDDTKVCNGAITRAGVTRIRDTCVNNIETVAKGQQATAGDGGFQIVSDGGPWNLATQGGKGISMLAKGIQSGFTLSVSGLPTSSDMSGLRDALPEEFQSLSDESLEEIAAEVTTQAAGSDVITRAIPNAAGAIGVKVLPKPEGATGAVGAVKDAIEGNKGAINFHSTGNFNVLGASKVEQYTSPTAVAATLLPMTGKAGTLVGQIGTVIAGGRVWQGLLPIPNPSYIGKHLEAAAALPDIKPGQGATEKDIQKCIPRGPRPDGSPTVQTNVPGAGLNTPGANSTGNAPRESGDAGAVGGGGNSSSPDPSLQKARAKSQQEAEADSASGVDPATAGTKGTGISSSPVQAILGTGAKIRMPFQVESPQTSELAISNDPTISELMTSSSIAALKAKLDSDESIGPEINKIISGDNALMSALLKSNRDIFKDLTDSNKFLEGVQGTDLDSNKLEGLFKALQANPAAAASLQSALDRTQVAAALGFLDLLGSVGSLLSGASLDNAFSFLKQPQLVAGFSLVREVAGAVGGANGGFDKYLNAAESLFSGDVVGALGAAGVNIPGSTSGVSLASLGQAALAGNTGQLQKILTQGLQGQVAKALPGIPVDKVMQVSKVLSNVVAGRPLEEDARSSLIKEVTSILGDSSGLVGNIAPILQTLSSGQFSSMLASGDVLGALGQFTGFDSSGTLAQVLDGTSSILDLGQSLLKVPGLMSAMSEQRIPLINQLVMVAKCINLTNKLKKIMGLFKGRNRKASGYPAAIPYTPSLYPKVQNKGDSQLRSGPGVVPPYRTFNADGIPTYTPFPADIQSNIPQNTQTIGFSNSGATGVPGSTTSTGSPVNNFFNLDPLDIDYNDPDIQVLQLIEFLPLLAQVYNTVQQHPEKVLEVMTKLTGDTDSAQKLIDEIVAGPRPVDMQKKICMRPIHTTVFESAINITEYGPGWVRFTPSSLIRDPYKNPGPGKLIQIYMPSYYDKSRELRLRPLTSPVEYTPLVQTYVIQWFDIRRQEGVAVLSPSEDQIELIDPYTGSIFGYEPVDVGNRLQPEIRLAYLAY